MDRSSGEDVIDLVQDFGEDEKFHACNEGQQKKERPFVEPAANMRTPGFSRVNYLRSTTTSVVHLDRTHAMHHSSRQKVGQCLESNEIVQILWQAIRTGGGMLKADETVVASCCVCLETLSDPVSVTACGHAFHGDCIALWVSQGKAECPVCRTRVDSRKNSVIPVKTLFTCPARELGVDKENGSPLPVNLEFKDTALNALAKSYSAGLEALQKQSAEVDERIDDLKHRARKLDAKESTLEEIRGSLKTARDEIKLERKRTAEKIGELIDAESRIKQASNASKIALQQAEASFLEEKKAFANERKEFSVEREKLRQRSEQYAREAKRLRKHKPCAADLTVRSQDLMSTTGPMKPASLDLDTDSFYSIRKQNVPENRARRQIPFRPGFSRNPPSSGGLSAEGPVHVAPRPKSLDPKIFAVRK